MLNYELEQAVDRFIQHCSYDEYYWYKAMMVRVPSLSQIDSVNLVKSRGALRKGRGLRDKLKFSSADKKVLFDVLFKAKPDDRSMFGRPIKPLPGGKGMKRLCG